LILLKRLGLNGAMAESRTKTLKWGEPSYLTNEIRSGSTIRIPKAALRHCIALALTYHRSGAKDYL
jgi:hypothetical protein